MFDHTPLLVDITNIEKRRPRFLERVDKAIQAFYETRRLRELINRLPAKDQVSATYALNQLDKYLSEAFDEWFYSMATEHIEREKVPYGH